MRTKRQKSAIEIFFQTCLFWHFMGKQFLLNVIIENWIKNFACFQTAATVFCDRKKQRLLKMLIGTEKFLF